MLKDMVMSFMSSLLNLKSLKEGFDVFSNIFGTSFMQKWLNIFLI